MCRILHDQTNQSNRSPEPGTQICSCVAQIALLLPTSTPMNPIVRPDGVPTTFEIELLSSPNKLIFRPPII